MGVTRHLALRGHADFLLEAINGQRGNQERKNRRSAFDGGTPNDAAERRVARSGWRARSAPRCATQPIVLRDRSTVQGVRGAVGFARSLLVLAEEARASRPNWQTVRICERRVKRSDTRNAR